MGPNVKLAILPLFVIVAALAAAITLSDGLERLRPPLPEGHADSDMTVLGSKLKGFAFGTEGLLADWYYMRGLQYIGAKILARKDKKVDLDNLTSLNPRLLYPMLDYATDLDPNFVAAYSYGAVVLPAIDHENAVALTQKGILNNPDRWELYRDLGYIYWKLKDYEKAAEIYDMGSRVIGAPPYMALMAGAMRTEGGSRDTARRIFQQMYEGTDDPAVRGTAEWRLSQLDALDEVEALDRALAEFKERNGRCANGLNEIRSILAHNRASQNKGLRLDEANPFSDPNGNPYLLDRENCRIKHAVGTDINH